MSAYQSFETERLLLKPTSAADAPFLHRLMNTPKWLAYIGDRNVHSDAAAEAYIKEKITAQFELLGYGNYTVVRKADGMKMGTCGLYKRPGLAHVDIGFAFLPQYEKQGYAFEAAQKIREVGLHEFGIEQIVAITVKENVSSQRLLEKLGLRFEEMIKLPGDEVELMKYIL